jgi:hypothetical protein
MAPRCNRSVGSDRTVEAMKRPFPSPHHKRPPEASPESILQTWRKPGTDKRDRVLAVAVRCIQCLGSAEAIRSCQRKTCGLWALRPYQADVPPRSAPHLERPEPTYEREPAGVEDP